MNKFLIIGLLLLLLGLTACGSVGSASTNTYSSSIASLEDRIADLETKVSALEKEVFGTAFSGVNEGLDSRVDKIEDVLNIPRY